MSLRRVAQREHPIYDDLKALFGSAFESLSLSVHGRLLEKRTHEHAEQGLILLHRLPQIDLECAAAGITNEHEAALWGECRK